MGVTEFDFRQYLRANGFDDRRYTPPVVVTAEVALYACERLEEEIRALKAGST